MSKHFRIGYIGNFGVDFSTESHVATAFEGNGHELVRLQENVVSNWELNPSDYDMILWTRTGWDWTQHGTTKDGACDMQRDLLERAADIGVPTIGYHLDRWWGLSRAGEVNTEPFFRVKRLISADGGHEQEWKDAGVNHAWLPPAVSRPECEPAEFDPDYFANVAFVGSWSNYHGEWQHRFDLIAHLKTFDCHFWPEPGHVVRGDALRRLYASTKVNVGDSCLVGSPANYWSDRIPETLGRGGFLLHPWVEGLEAHFNLKKHFITWPIGDWEQLTYLINYYVDHEDERKAIAAAGRKHVLACHTYEIRVGQILSLAGL